MEDAITTWLMWCAIGGGAAVVVLIHLWLSD